MTPCHNPALDCRVVLLDPSRTAARMHYRRKYGSTACRCNTERSRRGSSTCGPLESNRAKLSLGPGVTVPSQCWINLSQLGAILLQVRFIWHAGKNQLPNVHDRTCGGLELFPFGSWCRLRFLKKLQEHALAQSLHLSEVHTNLARRPTKRAEADRTGSVFAEGDRSDLQQQAAVASATVCLHWT